MKKSILILCEGVTDQILIGDCLEKFYNIKVTREVDKKIKDKINMTFEGGRVETTEGCKKLKMAININRLKDNTMEGGINLVIFDADKEGCGNNSYVNASRSLVDIKNNHGVNFDFYLWPNNSEDGKVENLIRKLIHPDRECVMKCIDSHQECLLATGFDSLRISEEKDRIRHYLYTNMISKTESRYIDYKDILLWNLNHSDIPDLEKFKIFLDRYFL